MHVGEICRHKAVSRAEAIDSWLLFLLLQMQLQWFVFFYPPTLRPLLFLSLSVYWIMTLRGNLPPPRPFAIDATSRGGLVALHIVKLCHHSAAKVRTMAVFLHTVLLPVSFTRGKKRKEKII